MGLTDYNNREIEIRGNGERVVTTHETGKTGYDDGYHSKAVYDKDGNLIRANTYNGVLYSENGKKTHDQHSDMGYKDGRTGGHGYLRSSIFDD